MKRLFAMLKKTHPYAVIGMLIFLSFSLAGCALFGGKPSPQPKTALKKISRHHYPKWSDDMAYDGLETAIGMSLSYLKRVPSDKMFTFGKDRYPAAHLIHSLQAFRRFIGTHPSADQVNDFIKKHFLIYKSKGNDKGTVLFTGYYEPTLKGSLVRSEAYPFPVYEKPHDLMIIDLSPFSTELKGKKIIGRIDNNSVVPYFERKEIENPAIFKDLATPIAWVKDDIDLFFLQIQGSGIITLPDGGIIRVHYNTSNGRAYKSIGKVLIDQGKVNSKEMSMQKIRAYLEAHPDEKEAIFNTNPSYVFFQQEKDGPFGCINVKLTSGRSAATDRKLFPEAALMFVKSMKPVVDGNGHIHDWSPFGRFFLNQDTGGAIKGPGRCDLFFGSDPYAEIAAGHMRQEGEMYFLVLKPGSVEETIPLDTYKQTK